MFEVPVAVRVPANWNAGNEPLTPPVRATVPLLRFSPQIVLKKPPLASVPPELTLMVGEVVVPALPNVSFPLKLTVPLLMLLMSAGLFVGKTPAFQWALFHPLFVPSQVKVAA